MTVTRRRKVLIYLALAVLITLSIYFFSQKIDQARVVKLVEVAGIWGPLIFILLFALTHVVAPLSAAPLIIPAYFLFGTRNFVFYMYLATILSATINFWISRRFGRSMVAKFAGKKNLKKIDDFVRDYGVGALVFMRFFTGYLTDFISYAYGLTKMKFKTYFIISVVVPIPWLIFWQIFIADRINNVADLMIWFYGGLIPFFIISLFFLSKFKRKEKHGIV